MNKLINQILITWRVSDGRDFEVIYEGEGEDFYENHKILDPFPRPLRKIKTTLRLEGGGEFVLAVDELPHLLPDRSGVLVIFNENDVVNSDFFNFSPPNNAAVFNADGSLRFRLKNPAGSEGIFRAAVSIFQADGSISLGVRACPEDYPVCESVYLIDGTTDDLSGQLPRWIRD